MIKIKYDLNIDILKKLPVSKDCTTCKYLSKRFPICNLYDRYTSKEHLCENIMSDESINTIKNNIVFLNKYCAEVCTYALHPDSTTCRLFGSRKHINEMDMYLRNKKCLDLFNKIGYQ